MKLIPEEEFGLQTDLEPTTGESECVIFKQEGLQMNICVDEAGNAYIREWIFSVGQVPEASGGGGCLCGQDGQWPARDRSVYSDGAATSLFNAATTAFAR